SDAVFDALFDDADSRRAALAALGRSFAALGPREQDALLRRLSAEGAAAAGTEPLLEHALERGTGFEAALAALQQLGTDAARAIVVRQLERAAAPTRRARLVAALPDFAQSQPDALLAEVVRRL